MTINDNKIWRRPELQQMDDLSIEIIRETIESDGNEYKYAYTLTYDNNNLGNPRADHQRWADKVANRERLHVKTYPVCGMKWERQHCHGIMTSPEPLNIEKIKGYWEHGKKSQQIIKTYEPHDTFKINNENYFGFNGGWIKYLYAWHEPIKTRAIHCPCRGKCRRQCIYENE